MLNYLILISTSFGWIPNNLVTPKTLAPSTALLPAEPHQKRSSMSGVLVRLHAHDFLAKNEPWHDGDGFNTLEYRISQSLGIIITRRKRR